MSLFHGKFNSAYCKAYSLGKYISVFVESEDDIPFWSRVFKKFAPHLKFRVFPATRGSLERGKTVLLDYSDDLGDFMLTCLDSDYDYLLQDTTPISRIINANPYILQTYTYSIENYKCFAENLEELCIHASLNDEPIFDFVEFFQQYSHVVYDLFLWSFYFRKIGDTTSFVSSDQSTFFGISGRINIAHNAHNVLQNLQTKIAEKIASFQESHPTVDVEPKILNF